jgi:N-methylhydantoinase A
VGQEHAVTVDLPRAFFEQEDREAIKRHFDEIHAVRYGTSAPDEPSDIVSLRVTLLGTMRKPPRHAVPVGDATPAADAIRATKPVYFRGSGFVDTPVYIRDKLCSGNRITGPALIEEHASTTVLQPLDTLEVDTCGNLQLTIGSDRS